MDLSKRDFLKLGSVPLLALLSSGTVSAQQVETDADGFQSVALLYGDKADRPEVGDGFFRNKIHFGYFYYDTRGGRYWITQDMDDWQQLNFQLPQYAEADLPSAQEPGQLVFNTDRGVISLSDGDDWEYPVVGDDILISPVTVSNTTTETMIWDAGLSVGTLKVGRVYEINLLGTYSNASTSDTVDLNIYLGGTLVANVGSAGQNAKENAPWRCKVIFTVRETGETGLVHPHAISKFNNVNADDDEPDVTVDTTVPEQIEAYAQWNNAKTGNSITLSQAYMKEVS